MNGASPDPSPHLPPVYGRAGIANLSGWRIGLILCVQLLAFLVLSGLLVSVFGGNRESNSFGMVFVASLALQPVIFLGTIYLLVIRLWGLHWSDLGVRAMPQRWVLRTPLIWAACVPVVALIRTMTDRVLGVPGTNPYGELFEALGPPTPGLVAAAILFGGLLVPFAEEVLFRGVLYPWLRSRAGIVVAAVLSAALFSALHVDPAVIPSIFFIGLVMAYLREQADSLWAPFVFHALQNTGTFVLLFWLSAAGAVTGTWS